MSKKKPSKRKEPTEKQIKDYLKAHGHKAAEVNALSLASKSDKKNVLTELHKREEKVGIVDEKG